MKETDMPKLTGAYECGVNFWGREIDRLTTELTDLSGKLPGAENNELDFSYLGVLDDLEFSELKLKQLKRRGEWGAIPKSDS